MNTPIADFVRGYAASGAVRLHMPGHKGVPLLGCEPFDITEIAGADSLYEADGIIAASEKNAAALFGAGRTLYAAEGSSQCIRAMVFLAVTYRRQDAAPRIAAARNAHKAFLYALALAGAEPVWLWPEERSSACSCRLTPEQWEEALSRMQPKPCAAYVTSPDYLGGQADIAGIAAVCRKHDIPLLADNAHGAYLHFLPEPQGPLDLGAAMCCESAHKTLPVLTGGAYLHIAAGAPSDLGLHAREAMALFGSTSPSYLIMQSLDLCNRCLSDEGYLYRLHTVVKAVEALRGCLTEQGWHVLGSDPLRLTLRCDGPAAAARLRAGGIEPEYADRDVLVLMASAETGAEELFKVAEVLGRNDLPAPEPIRFPQTPPETVCTPAQALFAPCETIPVGQSCGRICGAPSVSCPPAVPVVVSGERIGPAERDLLLACGVQTIHVIKA